MLDQLPEELLDICFEPSNRRSFRALRLVCKTTSHAASKRLFSEVTLKFQHASGVRCLKIMHSIYLRQLVRSFILQTSSDQISQGDGLPLGYRQCCLNLGKFANLRRVELEYESYCGRTPDDEVSTDFESDQSQDDIPANIESIQSRNAILSLLIRGLSNPENPARKLNELCVCNLPDPDLDLAKFFGGFEYVMKRLKTLFMHITDFKQDDATRTLPKFSALHSFFSTDLQEQWLRPTLKSLTSLALSCDTYWGVFPACYLSSLHFPHLNHLALGKYTFAHDQHFDWIFKHCDTLTSLVLDDCSIVHLWWMLDEDDYDLEWMGLFKGDPDDFDRRYHIYESRWHNYFDLIRINFINLTHFDLGKSYLPGFPVRAMAPRYQIEAEPTVSRYMIFVQGRCEEAEVPYINEDDDWDIDSTDHELQTLQYRRIGFVDEGLEPQYPDCAFEDYMALVRLKNAIRERQKAGKETATAR